MQQGSLTWVSDEYFGENERVMISREGMCTVDRGDDIIISTDIFPLGDERDPRVMIVSRLHIGNYSSRSIVSCLANDERFNKSISLQLIGKFYQD